MDRSNHVIDINPLAASIKEKLDKLCPVNKYCCIYRVPHRLRTKNKAAYVPKVVSIGPLHHKNKNLKKMEEIKMRYLKEFLPRTNVNLQCCINEIVKEGVERLYSCYEEALKLKVEDFVKMILVDAVFVIETLLRCSYGGQGDDIDRVMEDFINEFLLLENQLPFFILEDLFKLSGCSDTLIDCCYKFFTNCNFLKATEENREYLEKIKHDQDRPKHLLDLLRKFYEPKAQDVPHSSPATQTAQCIPNALTQLHEAGVKLITQLHEAEVKLIKVCIPNYATQPHEAGGVKLDVRIPNATQLREAGIKLKVRSSHNLLDIFFNFNKGTLEIPVLEINDHTDSILRNLIAFEQCHNCESRYLSDYTTVMDSIINTPKDVDLLVEKGILANWLGHSDDVSTIINRLGDGVCIDFSNNFYYASLYREINSYCKTRWHRWKATLKHNYFNTPWAIISFIAAVILIGLTITQTIFSIISSTNGN